MFEKLFKGMQLPKPHYATTIHRVIQAALIEKFSKLGSIEIMSTKYRDGQYESVVRIFDRDHLITVMPIPED
jgi:hypothetical protein